MYWSAPSSVLNLVAALILLFALFLGGKAYLVDQRNLKTICNFYQQAHSLDEMMLLGTERPYQKILKVVVGLGRFDWAVLFLMDFDTDSFFVADSHGISEKEFGRIRFDDIEDSGDNLQLSLRLLEHAFRKFAIKGALAGAAIEKNDTFYGCLLVGRYDPEAVLTEADNLRLSILSDQISISLHNFQMHQELALRAQQLDESQQQLGRELKMAKSVQESAITILPPQFPGLTCSAMVRPARFVGGDFLKFYPDPAHQTMSILVGDVCGKGVPAALILSVVLCLFQEKRALWTSPEKLMTEVNLALKEFLGAGSNFNSSAFFGNFNISDRSFTYASAGHDFPLYYQRNGDRLIPLESTGTLLGIFSESTYKSVKLQLETGDRIFFYSDGLVDFFEQLEKVEDGFQVLQNFIFDRRQKKPELIVNEIQALVEKEKTELKDDITLAIVELA
ncbi:MAG: PP2C family protein-serine/threonine phosphatase [Candidatus Rifleibacteriota bacterium]